jgi:hypothetical protein
MKFGIQLLATVIVCFILQSFLPWWTMAVGAFTVAYLLATKASLPSLPGLLVWLCFGLAWLFISMRYPILFLLKKLIITSYQCVSGYPYCWRIGGRICFVDGIVDSIKIKPNPIQSDYKESASRMINHKYHYTLCMLHQTSEGSPKKSTLDKGILRWSCVNNRKTLFDFYSMLSFY